MKTNNIKFTKATQAIVTKMLGQTAVTHLEAVDIILRKLKPVTKEPDSLGCHSREKIRLIAVLDDNDLVNLAMMRSGNKYTSKDEFYEEFGFTDSKDFSRHWRAEQVTAAIEHLNKTPPSIIDWLEPLAPLLGSKNFSSTIDKIEAFGWSKDTVLLALGRPIREHPVVKAFKAQLLDLDKALFHLFPAHPAHPYVSRVLKNMQAIIAEKSRGPSELQREFPDFFHNESPALGSPKATLVPFINKVPQPQEPIPFGNDPDDAPKVTPTAPDTEWPSFLKPHKYMPKKGVLRLEFLGSGNGTDDRQKILDDKEKGGLGFTYYRTRGAWELSIAEADVAEKLEEVKRAFAGK